MGVESERLLGLDSEGGVNSPTDDKDIYYDRQPRWRKRLHKRLGPLTQRRTIVFALVLLAISAMFFMSSSWTYKEDKSIHLRPQKPLEDSSSSDTSTDPDSSNSPSDDADGLKPLRPSLCPAAMHRFPEQVLPLQYGPDRNVSFRQQQHAHTGDHHVKVGGQVNVRQLDPGGVPRVVLEILTNDSDMRLDALIDGADQFMQISVPRKFGSKTGKDEKKSKGEKRDDKEGGKGQVEPCVEMRATFWVPNGGYLELLSISAMHLDILMFNDLNLHVESYSRMQSVIGNVVAGVDRPERYYDFTTDQLAGGALGSSIATPDTVVGAGDGVVKKPDYKFEPAAPTFHFNSRIIEVTTTTGRITGNWPLYDMLGLHTTAGDVKVSITPKPALVEASGTVSSLPKPAILSLSSVSGLVQATEPIHEPEMIPPREYLIDAHSTSGSIYGTFAFGPAVELKSTAGDIAVDLLPVMDPRQVSSKKHAQMETATTAGTTAVRILDPMWIAQPSLNSALSSSVNGTAVHGLVQDDTRPFDCLQSMHKSTSANIGLRYPQSWVGDILAESTSGALSIKGRDVQITRREGGRGSSSMVLGYKGKSGNGSTAHVEGMMGRVDVVIGEL